ncbi:MAG TPA: hypothetical protein VE177_07470, partial [Candidatus Binatus sp.]|nr:hypothetical protein [Candidatus Binatus sp.]
MRKPERSRCRSWRQYEYPFDKASVIVSRSIKECVRTRAVCAGVVALAVIMSCAGTPAHAEGTPSELTEMSLEELMNIEVTSVSKKT